MKTGSLACRHFVRQLAQQNFFLVLLTNTSMGVEQCKHNLMMRAILLGADMFSLYSIDSNAV